MVASRRNLRLDWRCQLASWRQGCGRSCVKAPSVSAWLCWMGRSQSTDRLHVLAVGTSVSTRLGVVLALVLVTAGRWGSSAVVNPSTLRCVGFPALERPPPPTNPSSECSKGSRQAGFGTTCGFPRSFQEQQEPFQTLQQRRAREGTRCRCAPFVRGLLTSRKWISEGSAASFSTSSKSVSRLFDSSRVYKPRTHCQLASHREVYTQTVVAWIANLKA